MKIKLPSVAHDLKGFEALVELHAGTKACFLDEIEIDMQSASWFDAGMCAALGAILYRLGDELNTIRLTKIPDSVEKILSKNGFLSNYGRTKIPDRWGTTIPYKRFDVKDDRYFGEYIEAELVRRPGMPRMSRVLIKKFRESIFEVFSNAVIHSQTKLGIFSCGQFFPQRHRIDFVVADLGIGIRQNVEQNAGLSLTAEKAIEWATAGRNTTRRGPVPGGLGLKLLGEFINLNGGRIQIVSDGGYWCLQRGRASATPLSQPFPGTIVSLEINTADKSSYALSTELSASNIF